MMEAVPLSSSAAHLDLRSLGRIGCIGTSTMRRVMVALLLGLSILASVREAGAVEIHFDTRFDGGFISQHPERLRTLELAAAIWGSLLTDHFAPVPPGTRVRMDNPRTGEALAVPMPAGYGDLLVFIFTDPGTSKAWAKLLSGRTDGYEAGRSAFSRAPRPGTEMIGDLYPAGQRDAASALGLPDCLHRPGKPSVVLRPVGEPGGRSAQRDTLRLSHHGAP